LTLKVDCHTELRCGRRRIQSGCWNIRELLKFSVKMYAYYLISAGCRWASTYRPTIHTVCIGCE